MARNRAYQSLKEVCSISSEKINKGQIFLFSEVKELVVQPYCDKYLGKNKCSGYSSYSLSLSNTT